MFKYMTVDRKSIIIMNNGGRMDEDINFKDIALISRIDDETTLENYGGKINTSFFESANLLGGLKVKGLVSFEQSISGHSPVKLTHKAHTILNLLKEKCDEKFNNLDQTILTAVSNGADNHNKIEKQVNVASFDIALHIYKLYKKGYLEYFIQSGRIIIRLTEKGFSKVKGVRVVRPRTKSDKKDDKPEKSVADTKNKHEKIKLKGQQEQPKQSQQTSHEKSGQTSVDIQSMRSKMLRSKIEFYFKKYWWVLALTIIIIVIGLSFLIMKLLNLV